MSLEDYFERNIEAFSKYRYEWTEENVSSEVSISKKIRVIKLALEAFEPICRLAIRGDINEPFSFQSYMMSYLSLKSVSRIK